MGMSERINLGLLRISGLGSDNRVRWLGERQKD